MRVSWNTREASCGLPGVVLDFNEQKQVVGIEMLNLSKRAPQLNPQALVSLSRFGGHGGGRWTSWRVHQRT